MCKCVQQWFRRDLLITVLITRDLRIMFSTDNNTVMACSMHSLCTIGGAMMRLCSALVWWKVFALKRGRLNQIGYFYAQVSWNLKSDHPWLMVGWVNILIAYICKTLNEWTMDWWMISWDCKWWECHGIMFSIRPSLAINSGKYLHFSVRGRLNRMNGFALQWDEISGLHKLATHGSLQWLR